MMDQKHCSGCRDNFYNGNNSYDIQRCWMLDTAKLVWRVPVGNWESPPYKGKKKVRVPDCFHGEGPNKTHYVNPAAIGDDGYWRL